MRDEFSAREASMQVGHVFGLRWFQVYDSRAIKRGETPLKDLRLHGAYGMWEPGENVATCKRGFTPVMAPPEAHDVPVDWCGCGFWAYWALGEKQVSPPSVVAIIKGYGRTIEGDLGFRSQMGRVEAITMHNWHEPVAVALEVIYQVPVYKTFGAMILRHPAPEDQPPLTDNYFVNRQTQTLSSPAHLGPLAHNGGWFEAGPGVVRAGVGNAVYKPASCARCHKPVNYLGQGETHCDACVLAIYEEEQRAHDAKLMAIRSQDPQARVADLHRRRERWARD